MFKQNVLKSSLMLLIFLLSFSCAQKGAELPQTTSQQLDGSMYNSKVDNFLVVIDTSSSMDNRYNGNKKIDIAKRIASDMNGTLPEMGQTAGLRSFGKSSNASKNSTAMLYGMEKYSSASLADGINKIAAPGGTTPLSNAITAATEDFEGLSGNHNALIIISDGLENGKSSTDQMTILKKKYGAAICVYTVLVGNAPQGEALLKKLTTIGNCGSFTKADQLLSNAGMKNFVETAFLTLKPAPVKVTVVPAPTPLAPKDSDNDGIFDDKDECPGTPIGAHVNAVGCWTLDQVLFDYDKATIKTGAYQFLNAVAVILEKNPNMNVSLEGHTDNIGPVQYNMELSKKRANAVKTYLVEKGISSSRMDTKSFGFTKPLALNGTDAGRALNRRVEINPK
ncbi:OmpA family protein [bacterium]|nr:OmpA family protein [bacterium]